MNTHETDHAQASAAAEDTSIELTVVIPCLDEADTIGICVTKAVETMAALGVAGEVVVADNGSSDGSQSIATQAGARVVDVPTRGYGAALMFGIGEARGKFVIM
ncbi:MAG: glycosyltransferase [Proteobacteria bacterium]|nr:glycosyltransferase [Pseudomonadota bacterium]